MTKKLLLNSLHQSRQFQGKTMFKIITFHFLKNYVDFKRVTVKGWNYGSKPYSI